ncbi:nucleoside hydrolase [Aliifodinibius sp. S!AR15-10]|uniref:nucleoside hydrolase n=1 Tax=Aliifodinibius sp. S!AR15-10 TaxID=2950437 RepID=UPI00285CB11D|nr:nucleoside hydrolase [Aliifodinibius sp. S!AR15-10]MDR8393757.1 nucleoside hydrolase [Aliifodinibius sp. S!AR15-10]
MKFYIRYEAMQWGILFLGLFIFSSTMGCSSDQYNRQATGHNLQVQSPKRILFDSDTNNEIDDQHALACLLFNQDIFDIEGITVNSTKEPSVDLDYAEAERILKLSKSYSEIPLHKGADGTFNEIRGQIDQPGFEGSEAVNFIIEQSMAAEEELILLAVGKLTNIALALEKEPAIASKARLVWLGSNYPEPGEHNQNADTTAMNYLLNSDLPFDMVTVRYGKPSGTDAVKVTKAQILQRMPGKGPHISEPVEGRHGGLFNNFGDYSVNLFENYQMDGDPPSRPLFDMAAVAIVKNPEWAESKQIPGPVYIEGEWVERPENQRMITIWENFHIYSIMHDFFQTMENPQME